MATKLTHVYAVVCPNCGEEMKYDRNYYDKKIAELRAQVTSMHTQLANHPYDGTKASEEWRRKTKVAQGIKEQQIQELRAFRGQANVLVKERIDCAFKSIVKEKIGLENYCKWMEEAESRCEYESAENLMKKE